MKYACDVIKGSNTLFWGGSDYLTLFVVSLVILFYVRKKYENINLMVVYTLLVLVTVVYDPIFTVVALRLNSDATSYYVRMFLLFPAFGIIAAAGTVAVWWQEKRSKVITALFVLMIVVTGMTFFSYGSYKVSENIYKVDGEAVEIADCIVADAKTERINVAFDLDGRGASEVLWSRDDSLLLSIRQYCAKITAVESIASTATYEEMKKAEALEYRESLETKMSVKNEEGMYQYIICRKNELSKDLISDGMNCVLETENYCVLK